MVDKIAKVTVKINGVELENVAFVNLIHNPTVEIIEITTFTKKKGSVLVWTDEMCKEELRRLINLKKELTEKLKGVTEALWKFEGAPPSDNWFCPEMCGDCESEYGGLNCCDLPIEMWNESIKQWKREIENE